MVKSLAQGNKGAKAEPMHLLQSLHSQPPRHTVSPPATAEVDFSLGSLRSKPQDKNLSERGYYRKWLQEAPVRA